MYQYDAHALLNRFYSEHVRLGRDRRNHLASRRDLNLQRLREGLEAIGPMRGAQRAVFSEWRNQGSYAMDTMNQHSEKDYDIDVAVIFDANALPQNAPDSRTRVEEAMQKTATNFARDPEARTNAVTVWYAEGYHVDLAIYRRTVTGDLEHAGAGWQRRDPDEITRWFRECVARVSPSATPGVTVEPEQLRRIVRLTKKFCRSRPSWSLPGGMITSALVAEAYVPHMTQDDASLFLTLSALRTRLARDLNVRNPVNPAQQLTAKAEFLAQVSRLEQRLDEVLPKLDVLRTSSCDESAARRAWNWVFRDDFWTLEKADALTRNEGISAGEKLDIVMGVATKQNGRIQMDYNGLSSAPVPKRVWVQFVLQRSLRPGETVRWTVQNDGDEAAAANELTRTNSSTGCIAWESTLYHGIHQMICEVLRNGEVVGRTARTVRIS